MANKHILSLEVPEVSNCEIFRVKDTSQYTEDLHVDCPELLITPPGFNAPKLIKVTPGFDLSINACTLGIQTEGCLEPTDDGTISSTGRSTIPDGIYIVRYSVSPNDRVYVEYNVLRTTTIMSCYYNKLCDVNQLNCLVPGMEMDFMTEMNWIRTMIDAAKAKIEYCQSPTEGMELYEFAKEALEKLNCSASGCNTSPGY